MTAREQRSNDELADHILARLEPFTIGPPLWLRWSLALLAVIHLSVALPWLVGTDPFGLLGDASASHLTRDGALGLVTSTAGLLTAWRPRYALAAALVSATALTAQIATALIDEHYRRVSFVAEGVHGITAAVTFLVAWFSRPRRPAAVMSARPRLHAVARPSED